MRVGLGKSCGFGRASPPRALPVVVVFGLACGLFPAEGVASGRWSNPETVAGRGHTVNGLDLAAGPGRYAVAVWSSGGLVSMPERTSSRNRAARVFASVRKPNQSTFGPPRAISPRRTTGVPTIVIGANGSTIVGWANRHGIAQVATRTPNQSWSDPTTLSGPDAHSPALAIAADGGAIAGWRQWPVANQTLMV